MWVHLLRHCHLELSSLGSSCVLHGLGATLGIAWGNFGPIRNPSWPEHHLTLWSSPFPGCLKGPLVQLSPKQGSNCVRVS